MLTIPTPPRLDSTFEWASSCSPQSHHAEGAEGQAIDDLIRSIRRDQQELRSGPGLPAEGNPEGYLHLPFKTVQTIRVRFQKAVPLPPRRIIIDDEDHET